MFDEGLHAYLRHSRDAIEAAIEAVPEAAMEAAVEACTTALGEGLPMLVCGNGGSAADAMHITGELVGRFLRERRALNAVCLSSNPSVLTAWANDYSYETVFARQVEAYGKAGGAVLGISTSGNSPNVLRAVEVANEAGATSVGFAGYGGGKLAERARMSVVVDRRNMQQVEDLHMILGHIVFSALRDRIKGLLRP